MRKQLISFAQVIKFL